MDTGNRLERGEGWENVERLIALARQAHRTELSPERRERIRDALLDKLDRNRDRRRRARAFAVGASTVLLAGLLLKVVSGVVPWVGRSSTELATKRPTRHLVAE